MIFEIAEIDIKPGSEAAFETAVEQAAPHFRSSEGCRSLELHRIVERPSTYKLVVGWDSVEHHTVGFRNSPNFLKWRELAGPHFASPPRVEHVSVALRIFADAAQGG